MSDYNLGSWWHFSWLILLDTLFSEMEGRVEGVWGGSFSPLRTVVLIFCMWTFCHSSADYTDLLSLLFPFCFSVDYLCVTDPEGSFFVPFLLLQKRLEKVWKWICWHMNVLLKHVLRYVKTCVKLAVIRRILDHPGFTKIILCCGSWQFQPSDKVRMILVA